MADEHNDVQTEEQGASAPQQSMTIEQRLAAAEEALAEERRTSEALKKKGQELLGETKAEREKRREYEAKQQQLERERMEQEGQHQELSKKWQSEAEKYKSELEALNRSIASEKLGNAASKLAHEYASDAQNAKLLERFIRDELDYVDQKVVATNHASIEDMIKSMEQSGGYASLWRGSKASGGGATGAGGGAASKSLKDMNDTERAELLRDNPQAFEQMVAQQKMRK